MKSEVLKDIVNKFNTPAYVFDLDMLKKRVLMIKTMVNKELGDRVNICYAMKANPFLVAPLKGVIDSYEVCSPGEFRICEKAEIDRKDIVLSGVNKEKKDIAYVMDTYGADGIFTIESRLHLKILEECAKQKNLKIKALVRLTSGNQFGLDEGEVLDIFTNRDRYPHVHLTGIQLYSGTQKKKLSKLEKELQKMDEICIRIKEESGYEVEHVEYGPGFFVPYFEAEDDVNDQALLEEFAQILAKLQFQGIITLEMGRYIAAYCGYYLTSIVDQKTNKGQNYVIVDGGINHLNYYGQMMAMKIPHYYQMKLDDEEIVVSDDKQRDGMEEWNICGSLCTVNDVLVKQLPLYKAEIGDVLVFERVGAYSVTEGMYLFLSRDLPKVIFYDEENGAKVVRMQKGTDEINCVEKC